MAWESFNDIYVPNTGGSIEGDLEVSGNLTVNDGSGEGTTYDVASEITELKSAWDSVSQDISDLIVKPTMYTMEGSNQISFSWTGSALAIYIDGTKVWTT